MGDAAHLRVRGGVTVILWRQEGTRMQALACTAQQVSGEKMGGCAPANTHSTLDFPTCAEWPVIFWGACHNTQIVCATTCLLMKLPDGYPLPLPPMAPPDDVVGWLHCQQASKGFSKK